MRDCKNKRRIHKSITPQQLLTESEGSNKWFYIIYSADGDGICQREYTHKEDIQRILDAETTTAPEITVIELVDDG